MSVSSAMLDGASPAIAGSSEVATVYAPQLASGPEPPRGKVATFVLAGGRGTRLEALTEERPKPLLPFASHQLIDFTLSNCALSGLESVSVLAQYRAQAMKDYLGRGEPWGFDTNGLHLRTLTAARGRSYAGTADAVRQHIDEPGFAGVETVVVLAADHVYAMDYRELVEHHGRSNADVTIGTVCVPAEQASQFGIVDVDTHGLVRRFQEKPAVPSGRTASMGIYVFGAAQLRLLLSESVDDAPTVDFGHDVLPLALRLGMRVAAYEFKGYWRDIGTPKAYLDAHRDAVHRATEVPAATGSWPIATRAELLGEVAIGEPAIVRRSLILGGARVDGIILDSALLPGVHVDEGAIVRNSVLLRGVHVERGAVINHAVIDRGATVRGFARIGAERPGTVTVVPAHSVVGAGHARQAGQLRPRSRRWPGQIARTLS